MLAQPAQHLEAVDQRQLEVKQHDKRQRLAGFPTRQHRDSLGAVAGDLQRVAKPVLGEGAPRELEVHRVVFDQEDRACGIVHEVCSLTGAASAASGISR